MGTPPSSALAMKGLEDNVNSALQRPAGIQLFVHLPECGGGGLDIASRRKLRMIQSVEGVYARLDDHPLSDREVFEHGKIEIVGRIAAQQVLREGAVIPASRLVVLRGIED